MKFDNSNQLDINDIKLNYHENGQGNVLVFIHGNTLASGTFINLHDYFSDRYKVDGIKKWLRNIFKFLKILLMPFTKYFNPIRIQKWKLDLMLNDMDISEIDLKLIMKPTLILCAENEFVYEKHTLDMHKNIKDSVLKVIKKTNHSNIIFNKKIIKIIDEFLD